MKGKCLLLFVLMWCLSGCATPNYFPLSRKDYFEAQPKETKKVVIFPFNINIYYNSMTPSNSAERAEEKRKEGISRATRMLKDNLTKKGYEVIEAVSIEEFKEVFSDNEKLVMIDEIYGEWNGARYSIGKNLNDEKGKNFDYSVGVRVEELNKKMKETPDMYCIILAHAYVNNLAIFEKSVGNALAAVLTLGTSTIPDGDSLLFEVALIDARTGNILWINNHFKPRASILLDSSVESFFEELLEALPNAIEKNEQREKSKDAETDFN